MFKIHFLFTSSMHSECPKSDNSICLPRSQDNKADSEIFIGIYNWEWETGWVHKFPTSISLDREGSADSDFSVDRSRLLSIAGDVTTLGSSGNFFDEIFGSGRRIPSRPTSFSFSWITSLQACSNSEPFSWKRLTKYAWQRASCGQISWLGS